MSIVLKKAKKIILAIVSLFVAAVISLLVWRVFFSDKIPERMLMLTPTDAVREAYEKSGDDLYMFKQKTITITRAEGSSGYFSVSDYVIIPDANEVQFLLRYNTSTLKRTAEDYGLDQVPSRDDEVYEVSLLISIDITPEDMSDNSGNDASSVKLVRCKGTVVGSEKKNMYNYRRIIFDLDDAEEEIDIKQLKSDKLLIAIYADINYDNGNINYDDPDGTLLLYEYLSPDMPVELNKNNIKALKGE